MLKRGDVQPPLFGVPGETVSRRRPVCELDLRGNVPAAGGAVDAGFLGADRLREYEELRPGHGARAEQRFAAGHRCFATWADGELAGARWVATDRACVEYLGLDLELETGE